jgi:hypothetical protein
MKKSLLFVIIFIAAIHSYSQTIQRKQLSASRITGELHIDGNLNEPEWLTAEEATDFTQFQFNWSVPSAYKTSIKVIYDNTAIYIGATMYDPQPDSIQRDLSARDEFGSADFIGIIMDPYSEGVNGLEFFVTASGVQAEAKTYPGSNNDEDFTWDAVWVSAAKITDQGWIAEMKIPYSAIRFPNKEEQSWYINFVREVKRNRDKSAWNAIDPQIQGFVNQSGILTGIRDIKAPVRLSLSPYFSTYYDTFNDKEAGVTSDSWSVNGGADVKYGLNDAFTLDMTLVPDFGQVQSDNQVLNLTPFEVFFVEQRQFFTEGTELFNKGNLFYSRRVGGTPIGYYNVLYGTDTASTIVSNPTQTRLLNAAKISGRTSSGLGIGLFNAVEGETVAVIEDSTGTKSNVVTGPKTNYNVLVFDQSLKNNSYVTFTNSNVMRDNAFRDANASSLRFSLNDKKTIWAIEGIGAYSQQFTGNETGPETGVFHALSAGKSGGKRRFAAGYEYTGPTYNNNDLGYLPINNLLEFYGTVSYHTYEPLWRLNQLNLTLSSNYVRIINPDAFHNFSIGADAWGNFRNFLFMGLFIYTEPVVTYDYFEPREPGRYYTYPINYNFGGWISTDYSKRFAFDASSNFRIFDEVGRYRHNIDISPRFRVSDKILLTAFAGRYFWPNDIGWVNTYGDSIILGRRDNVTFEGQLQAKYTPNVKMNIGLRLRHYWSFADYNAFYNLGDDGSLLPTTYNTFEANGSSTDDVNFNAFNVDLVYTWFFAPGSELNIVWKNSIYQFGTLLPQNYFDDLDAVFDAPVGNNFSIKLLYYLDYLYLKKH